MMKYAAKLKATSKTFKKKLKYLIKISKKSSLLLDVR